MKYLKVFEIYKSTNPIKWIDREDIIDIMLELTDEYDYLKDDRNLYIKNDKEVVVGAMERRVLHVKYVFEIPDDKLEDFKKSLALAEWRFHQLNGVVSHGQLRKITDEWRRNNTDFKHPIYGLLFSFYDCKVEN